MATPLSDNLAKRRAQLATLANNPTQSVGQTAPTPELSLSGNTPNPSIRSQDAPELSMSSTTPPVYVSPLKTPTDQEKYGGTQVAGTNGQKNVGVDGYTVGKDAYKLGSVANSTNTSEAIRKINEDQSKKVADASSVPSPTVRDGYSVPGTAEAGLVETPTTVKDPMSTYLDYLNGINTKMQENTFNATKTQQELMNAAGVENDQNELNVLDAEAQQIELNKKARIQAQSNQTIPASVYGGRISEIERQENTRIAEINARKNTLMNQINTKNNMISMTMANGKYDYEQAQNQYKTQYSQAMDAIQLFRTLKNDALAEQEYKDNKVAAAQKAQADAIKAQKTDARANLQVYYDNIVNGAIDPSNMTESQQLNIAKQEMIVGLPIGTFNNLANKFKGEDMKGQAEDYYDAEGNKYLQFVMQDKKTGKITVRSMQVAADYREVQKMAADETALSKGTYELGIKKNEYDMLGTENAIKKQQLANSILTGQKSYNDIAKDTTAVPSNFINPKASKYGMALATDGSVVFNLEKKDAKTFKSLPGRSQCGEFVNDALGLTGDNRIGDSFESKARLAKNTTPQVGGAFVQKLSGKYAANGHIGVVTKTYPDGSFDFMDANRDGKDDGTITTGHMTLDEAKQKGVVGFTDGYKQVATTTKTADTQDDLDAFKGSDGKVSQDTYKTAKKKWIRDGGDGEEFDKKFLGYIDATHWQDYGISSKLADEYNFGY